MPGPALPLLRSRRAWRVLFWALLIAVSTLMLVPRPPPTLDTGWDKANHLLAFAAPAFAGIAALVRRDRGRMALLGLALLAWGGALELLQGLLPPRSAEWTDWLADAAGIALGAAAYAVASSWLRPRVP